MKKSYILFSLGIIAVMTILVMSCDTGGSGCGSSSDTETVTATATDTDTDTQPIAENTVDVYEYGDGTFMVEAQPMKIYSGSSYFDAVNAAIDYVGEGGLINIYASGDSGSGGDDVYAIKPRANQTLDFHDNEINCNGNALVVGIQADNKDGITVENLNVVGAPRYGLWFRGCSNLTLHNITMDLDHPAEVGLGIRVDASKGEAKNLTISGEININGSLGHAIETYGVDGFSIGDVTVTNSGGCGLILNDSRNGTVGNVTGHNNCWGGGYATFRVANDNGPNVHVESVYSRNSGRGFFSVSGSNGTTIEYVDIDTTTSQGIFLEDATDTHVLDGKVSNGNPNCQEVRTSNCSINVSGC